MNEEATAIISPGRIAWMAVQVSTLIAVCIGVTTLLLPLTGTWAILGLGAAMLAGYLLLVGYLGLSSLYLLLHYRQMKRRQVALAAVTIGLFAIFWGGIFERGYNATIRETRGILSSFATDKGLLAKISVANAVRGTYRRAVDKKVERGICRNEEDFLRHLPVYTDNGIPISKLTRELEASYKSVSCF